MLFLLATLSKEEGNINSGKWKKALGRADISLCSIMAPQMASKPTIGAKPKDVTEAKDGYETDDCYSKFTTICIPL